MSLCDKWLCAIQDSPPCGEDVSFDPTFEQIRDEVEKSTSIHMGQSTDWEQVLALTSMLLETKSKDLWLYCYGCRAAYALGGLHELNNCLQIVAESCKNLWDDLYPSVARPARRAAPFKWLIARLESFFSAGAFPVESDEEYEKFRTTLTNLQTTLEAKLGENAPSFGDILRTIPAVAVAQELEEKDESKGIPVSAHRLSQPEVFITSLNEEGRVPDSIFPQLLRNTTDMSRQLGDHYLSLNPSDWRTYLLHRCALWATISQLPQAATDGLTQLRPLPKGKLLEYESAMESKQFSAILPHLERSASKAPFWFDGHFMVVRCLEAIEAKQAKDTVCFILQHFIARFPELLRLKFYDGSPFASHTTVQWIEGLQQKSLTPKTIGAPWTLSSQAEEKFDGEQREEALLHGAIQTAEQDGFEKGFAVLGAVPMGKSSKAIRHAILQARFFMMTGKNKAAKRLLTEVYSKLEQWDLLEWNPDVSAQLISLILKVDRTMPEKEQDVLLQRLHWLHIDTALTVSIE